MISIRSSKWIDLRRFAYQSEESMVSTPIHDTFEIHWNITIDLKYHYRLHGAMAKIAIIISIPMNFIVAYLHLYVSSIPLELLTSSLEEEAIPVFLRPKLVMVRWQQGHSCNRFTNQLDWTKGIGKPRHFWCQLCCVVAIHFCIVVLITSSLLVEVLSGLVFSISV